MHKRFLLYAKIPIGAAHFPARWLQHFDSYILSADLTGSLQTMLVYSLFPILSIVMNICVVYDGKRRRPDRVERPDHVKRLDHVERPDRVERLNHVKRPDHVERPVRVTA